MREFFCQPLSKVNCAALFRFSQVARNPKLSLNSKFAVPHHWKSHGTTLARCRAPNCVRHNRLARVHIARAIEPVLPEATRTFTRVRSFSERVLPDRPSSDSEPARIAPAILLRSNDIKSSRRDPFSRVAPRMSAASRQHALTFGLHPMLLRAPKGSQRYQC